MNGARRFAADHLHNARMRVPQSVYCDTAKKIEVLLAGGIVHVGAAPVREDQRRPFVGGQQKSVAVQQTLINARAGRCAGTLHRRRPLTRFCKGTLHAADSAAWAAERDSRMIRVPGITGTTATEVCAARTASSRASGAPPPTIRTSRTWPSMARLAASSFKTIPPETTWHCTRRSTSSQVMVD